MPKAAFIINPKAGKKQTHLIEKIIQLLSEDYNLVPLCTIKEAAGAAITKQLLAEKFDLVIVGGGDGSINEVINVLAETSIPIGIIPFGTMNVLARELGIPLDPWQAAKTLARGRISKITLGNINGHYFSLMAGVGWDAQTVLNLEQSIHLKRKWGGLSYVLTGLKTLRTYSFPLFSVSANGQEYLVYSAVISNIKRYGGGFLIAPDTSIFDPELTITLCKKKNILRLIPNILRIIFRLKPESDVFENLTVAEVVIDSELPLPIQIDGDFWGYTPAKIKVVPFALSIITPDESTT